MASRDPAASLLSSPGDRLEWTGPSAAGWVGGPGVCPDAVGALLGGSLRGRSRAGPHPGPDFGRTRSISESSRSGCSVTEPRNLRFLPENGSQGFPCVRVCQEGPPSANSGRFGFPPNFTCSQGEFPALLVILEDAVCDSACGEHRRAWVSGC